eukprot:scaffold10356_cov118-Isochrysis_galbana.AAC.5
MRSLPRARAVSPRGLLLDFLSAAHIDEAGSLALAHVLEGPVEVLLQSAHLRRRPGPVYCRVCLLQQSKGRRASADMASAWLPQGVN